MNWAYFTSIFGISTIKYLFSHVLAIGALQNVYTDVEVNFINIFLPTFAGAFTCMLVFYFASDFFMDRAARKRKEKLALAIASGKPLKQKKKFTLLNKLMVKAKARFGIYALTFIAPLFFSIPLGSIICAKFYGDQKITFPLMTGFMALYGVVVTLIIVLING